MGRPHVPSIRNWPLLRQLAGRDPLGLGSAARSEHTRTLRSRTETADKVVPSICPYCAVGCGQRIYVKNGAITSIEGDPDSPISRGRLCPKGSASRSLVTSERRLTTVRYRRPHSTTWEDIPLDQAMEMIADRVVETRAGSFVEWDENGGRVNRTLAIAHLGGATLDNEENYLIKKLLSALGVVQVENQARI
jgi:formate dehydrogenase major subunit